MHRALAILTLFTCLSAPTIAADLELKQGDHICLVGNALGERMQHHNQWESSAASAISKAELDRSQFVFSRR